MSNEIFLRFSKYHGLGNHFIFVDNREGKLDLNNPPLIRWLCDSRTGVGADGVAEIKTCDNLSHKDCKYQYVYYVCDGRIGAFCGNGSRCSVQFAVKLGIVSPDEEFIFCGFDGEHLGRLESETELVHVKMNDIKGGIEKVDDKKFRVVAGSDMMIVYEENLHTFDFERIGYEYLTTYQRREEGFYVMFVKESDRKRELFMRSYECGLNGETWACGTGAIGASLVAEVRNNVFTEPKTFQTDVNVRIGKITIRATRTGSQTFKDVYLIGPASHVYDGKININL